MRWRAPRCSSSIDGRRQRGTKRLRSGPRVAARLLDGRRPAILYHRRRRSLRTLSRLSRHTLLSGDAPGGYVFPSKLGWAAPLQPAGRFSSARSYGQQLPYLIQHPSAPVSLRDRPVRLDPPGANRGWPADDKTADRLTTGSFDFRDYTVSVRLKTNSSACPSPSHWSRTRLPAASSYVGGSARRTASPCRTDRRRWSGAARQSGLAGKTRFTNHAQLTACGGVVAQCPRLL